MINSPQQRSIIAIDPGTHKCGIALLNLTGEVTWKGIVPSDDIATKTAELLKQNPGALVVIGASTRGAAVAEECDKLGITTESVDETNSTMEARNLFWTENRPGCFWSIFPPSFRPLPRPIDDYAAVIIGKRYLSNLP